MAPIAACPFSVTRPSSRARKASCEGKAAVAAAAVATFEPLPDTPLEDAPEGHEAWTQVKFQAHSQGHLYYFKGPFHFQVTFGMALNSGNEAARICRLCYYMHTTTGASKEQLVEFRNRQFRSMKSSKRRIEEFEPEHAAEEGPSAKQKRHTGAVGSSWASQLGTKHSRMRATTDPLADFFF